MENIFLLEEVLKFQKLSGLISEQDYKSNLKKINTFENSTLGQITKALQKEYINNIDRSTLFNESECKYLKEYFKKYTTINESNIRKHNLLLKEGFLGDVGKFFGDAWSKIKQVYGNIKDFVLKIWEFLKNSCIKIAKGTYTYIKNQLNSKKQAMIAYLAKVKDKQGLDKETNHALKIFQFIGNLIKNFWNTISTKLLTNPELSQMGRDNLREIFTSRRMIKLFESTPGGGLPLHPEELVKNPAAKRLITWISYTVRIVLNPIGFIILLGLQGLTKDFFQISNKALNKIGGPEVIKWVILPTMITVVLEKTSYHHTMEQFAETFLGVLFPEVEQLVKISSTIYAMYGWYEIIASLTNI
jgi:2C-methyl-D-erythritol 2,4-cyclodiphosphate synthase